MFDVNFNLVALLFFGTYRFRYNTWCCYSISWKKIVFVSFSHSRMSLLFKYYWRRFFAKKYKRFDLCRFRPVNLPLTQIHLRLHTVYMSNYHLQGRINVSFLNRLICLMSENSLKWSLKVLFFFLKWSLKVPFPLKMVPKSPFSFKNGP